MTNEPLRAARSLTGASSVTKALCTALLLLAGTAHAQAAPRSAAILILKGDDTLVVERVRRTESAVTARVAMRGQPQMEMYYALGADHAIAETEFSVRGAGAPADAAPLQQGTVRFVGDSALLDVRAGGASRAMRLGTRAGAWPIVNNDFVLAEQLVRVARARGVTTLTVPLFSLAGGVTIDGTLALVGADSARFTVGPSVTELAVDASGNVTGGRIPAQGLRIVVVTGADAARISLGRPDYSAPAGAPYTAEEVTVRTPAGHVLTGTLTRPVMGTAVPAVVTITGSGAQDRDEYIPVAGGFRLFRQVADTLGRRGIAVLRLDDRGINGSGGDVNGTSADFADDIRAAVAYLRARSDIDGRRIALVGHSEGGMIAPMLARDDAALAAIVLMAGPAYTGRAIIDYQIANSVLGDTGIAPAKRDSAAAARKAQFDSSTATDPWMRFFLAYDPIPTARRVKQPVLILHGATDQQVRPEEATMLAEALKAGGNARVTTRIFADRNHLFLRDPDGHPSGYAKLAQPRIDGEVMGALADWLATTLRAP